MIVDGWLLLAENKQSGVSTWAKYEGDDVIIQERQDVDALLDDITAQRNVAEDGWKGDGLHSVARIPLAMLHDTQDGIGRAIKAGDDDYVTKFLNDSNFGKLRTKEGML